MGNTLKYELPSNQTIEIKPGLFNRFKITVGIGQTETVKIKHKKPYSIPLKDGKSAVFSYSKVGFIPEYQLYVDDELMLPTASQWMKDCKACEATNRPNDRFCVNCGAGLPTAETLRAKVGVSNARGVIMALAVLFLLSGAFLFYTERKNVQVALTSLAQFQDSDTFPQLVDGQRMTIGEVKARLNYGLWSVFIVNTLLAVFMLGLWFWASTSPFPAMVVAGGIYAAVIVINTVMDPRTLTQGIVLKIIIISLLANGIKSALATRHETST